MQRKRTSKLFLIIGTVLILAGAAAVYLILVGVQDNVNVMEASKDLPAYSFVDSSSLQAVGVPKASVTDNDLTESEFKDTYNGKFVISSPVLESQRIDKRYIPQGENASFAVVLPDERVISATSTVAGAAVGTVQAGDVVDVNTEAGGLGANAAASTFDKVLCIATQPSGCQGVLPPGVSINADDDKSSTPSSPTSAPVIVLLAVPAEDSSAISGQTVTLSLNPFCRVDNEGYFFSPRKDQGADFLCQAPANRLASRGPDAGQASTTPAG